MSAKEKHIISCEYPPQIGGVSDYTRLIAHGLAARGESIHVWGPSFEQNVTEKVEGVVIHRSLGKFSPADLCKTDHELKQFGSPLDILVQWVPHGYGYRSLNLFFCVWLWKRAFLNRDKIQLIVHEPCLAFGEGSWKQNLAAAFHRIMLIFLLGSTRLVWVTIPEWEKRLKFYTLGRKIKFIWLPLSSNVEVENFSGDILKSKQQLMEEKKYLIGHFGTYSKSIITMLLSFLPNLLENNPLMMILLLGSGSENFYNDFILRYPNLKKQMRAFGYLPSKELSNYLSLCDVMFQPYPEGVNSRHTSAMAGLCHGIPLVATCGKMTEPIWFENESVKLISTGNEKGLMEALKNILVHDTEKNRLSEAAKKFYEKNFSWERTIDALLLS